MEKKRIRLNGTFRWSNAQVQELLQAICDKVSHNIESFEKPTSQLFYKSILEKHKLTNINWQIAKTKVRHLKSSYVAAATWKKQTGAGLLADGQEQSVSSHINKICPHFDILDEIFGQRRNVQPRNVYATNSGIEEFMNMSFNPDDLIEFDENYDDSDLTENPIDLTALPNDESVSSQPTQSSTATTSHASALSSPKPKGKNNANNMSVLLSIQEKRLNLEIEMFNWEREKEKSLMELKKAQQEHQNQIALLQIEKEKLAIEKLKREMSL